MSMYITPAKGSSTVLGKRTASYYNGNVFHGPAKRVRFQKQTGKPRRYKSGKGAFNRAVKSAMVQMAEKKHIQYAVQTNVFGYNAAAQGLLQLQLTPTAASLNIAQGLGEADRIGDKVRVKKVTLKYVISAGPLDATYNAVPAPQDVRCLITWNKQSKVLSPPAANFFDAGDSSAAPTSNMLDMIQSPNSEYVGVHADWTHKVGVQTYPHPNTTDNNDYKLNVIKSLDITKFYPKVLTWNDTATVIMEQSKWLTLLVAPANLSAIDTSGTTTFKPLFMNYVIDLSFTDF